jgi:hypothetical protein
VIDLPKRKLLGKIKTPRPLAGIAISADDRTVIAVDDAEPTLFLIDTDTGRVREELRLEGVAKPAQIARYAPNFSLLAVTSLNSDTVSLIDPSFCRQTAIKVGSQPMDMVFRGDELFVACQGDGRHVVDISRGKSNAVSARAKGCESLDFFRCPNDWFQAARFCRPLLHHAFLFPPLFAGKRALNERRAAHMMVSARGDETAPCAKPQPVDAMTFSRPTSLARRTTRSATSSGCSTTLVAWLMTPGMSNVSFGNFTLSHTRHSCSWRGLAPSITNAPTFSFRMRLTIVFSGMSVPWGPGQLPQHT